MSDTITKVVVPYEVLIRLNPDGTAAGAQVQRLKIVTDEDGPIHTVLPAEPVSLAGEAGIPLDDVLGIVTAGALRAVEEAKARVDAADAARVEQDGEVSALRNEAASLREENARLRKELLQIARPAGPPAS